MTEFGFFEMLNNRDFLVWANRKAYRAHCSQDLDDLLQRLATKLFIRFQRNDREFSYKYLRLTFCHLLISHTRSAQYKRARRTYPLPIEIEDANNTSDDRNEYFRSMLRTLSVEQRLVLELRFIETLSLGEIAQRLYMPQNTVKSHLRRALIQLHLTLNAPWN